MAFTYNGAGTGAFFLDGQPMGQRTEAQTGGITRGNRNLSIGDRLGSNYHGFPGRIDQVRISNGVLEFRPFRIGFTSPRHVFVRMEPNAEVRFELVNLQNQPLKNGCFFVDFAGKNQYAAGLDSLAPGESKIVSFPIDTRMHPDRYRLTAKITTKDDKLLASSAPFSIEIVPRKLPGEFPVVMWGGGLGEIERLKEVGFTHAIGLRADYQKIWKAGQPGKANKPETIRENITRLDDALAAGITICSQSSPGSFLRTMPEFQRVGRDGKPYPTKRPDICPLLPKVQEFVYLVGVSMCWSYGRHPAYGAALLHTEVRDQARPCFHPVDFADFKKSTGLDIPPEAAGPRGVDWHKIEGFPENRVIPDTDPIYLYYKWYWKQGDGWNRLNSKLHHVLKDGRKGFWTWHDPAVRVASVFGSGGEVDVISQWTYSYPDPIRIGLATDELLTMASGAEHDQAVMKMTQLIWYRSQTAPEPEPGKPAPAWQAAWEREQPDAPFITIPPMHLREAFWTKIARPIKGIMYHGWGSLVPVEGTGGYRFTHPETRHELARLIRTVVRPLGPTLKAVSGVRSDVAFYECFASQVYARRGTYGWGGGWGGDAWHITQWAGLQPDIIYDESIEQTGLDRFKVLFMADCDVVAESVLKAILAFQKRGGIVVGDDRLTPAIHPDILIETYKRTGNARKDKDELLARAGKLRAALANRYDRYAKSSNPEILAYRRQFGDADYIFLVNDRREYGRYVGQHGLVMENGLPAETRITLNRPSGVAYDLVNHSPVDFRRENGRLAADFHLGPCDGRIVMVVPTAIARVKIGVPKSARRGDAITATVEVIDAAGKPIDAAVPLEVTIEDPAGRPAEWSGPWTATWGEAAIPIQLAPNDAEGVWQVRVRELASGRTGTATFRVGAPPATTPETNPPGNDAGNAVQPNG